MTEFYQAVYEILTAATTTGGELDGLTVLRDEHEGLKTNCVVISRLREVTVGESSQYQYVEGHVEIADMVGLDKRDGATSNWPNAKAAAENWARKIKKVLMANTKLECTSYPGGLTKHPEQTGFLDKTYGSYFQDSMELTYVRQEFKAKYVYRNGAFALQ